MTQLWWKWYQQEAHISHPNSAQDAPIRFRVISSLAFPVLMAASFTSVCSGSTSLLVVVELPQAPEDDPQKR